MATMLPPPQKECEHEWGASVEKVPSTCTTVGEAERTCTKCGEKKTEEIPLHHYVDYKCKDCSAWGKGPAGGYVFYDKGSYSDGWRYLEAAPADLRVVDGKPTVDSTASGYDNAENRYIFGYYRTSASEKNKAAGTNISIGSGEANTQNLVEKMGDNAYTYSSGSETTADYAARLCSILEYEHDGVFYTDWFLPSKDELNLMYENLKKKGIGSFADDNPYYWSSSERAAGYAWKQNFASGYQYDYTRDDDGHVRPIRAF